MIKFFSILWVAMIANAAPLFEKEWTGKYLGGNVGAIFNQGNIEASHIAFSAWDGLCYQKGHFASAFIGPQIGIQKQYDSKAVIGGEGDYTYNFSQFGNSSCECEFDASIYDKFSWRNRSQLSLKGRLGYALKHNVQPFFAAGVSFSDLGLSYNNEINNSYSHTQLRPGYVLSTGIDWAYTEYWNFRLEYNYYQYNPLDLTILHIYEISDFGGMGQLKLSANTVRVALNYWF